MVGAQKQQFFEEKVRKKKRAIATNIMNAINDLQPPGRFLTEDHSQGNGSLDREGADNVGNVHPNILNKTWICVDPEKALSKTLQRLREKKEVIHNPTLNSGWGSGQKLGAEESADVAAARQSPIISSVGELKHRQSPTDSIKSSLAFADLISNDVSTSPGQCFPDTHQSNVTEILLSDASSLSTQKLRGLVESEAEARERNILDEEVDAFLRHFSAQHDSDVTQELRKLTLQKWMERSKPNPGESGNVSEYIKSALPIALKLTECLIEAEKDEQNGRGNPIPLASIATANVLIRAKELVLTGTYVGQVQEVVEHVWITSCVGEDSRVTSRLFALGVVLYELFSPDSPLQEDMPTFDATSNSLSMNSINLYNKSNGNHRPSKRSQRQLSISEGNISQCTARLESKGAPSSICALIRNILDCSNGDFCGDDAYKSFADLQLDLQLMMNDPSRFLDNIEANPMQPLSICNKLYGRENEMNRLEDSYLLRLDGKCSGVIIKGGAGIGKSVLAMHVQELTNQSNGYFSVSKFDQNKDVVPLSTIGTSFNSLCDLFVQDATPTQLKSVEEALDTALTSQAGLLAGVVPSLKKLMPSCVMNETSSSCVDSARVMRYLFGKLLLTLTSHSRSISIFVDDVQWADSASLLLISALLSDTAGCSSVFFTFSYRDDDVSKSGPFNAWLSSISMFSLEVIELKDMSPDSVNNLVSDSLHLSPRITHPLASVLHHKTRGNPLFLRQLIESLKEQGDIYVDLSRPRWSWDLNKIMDMEIYPNVLALLIKDMRGLPTDLQLGLKVASCWGSCVKYSIVDILSEELKVDLVDILQQVSKRGFMINNSDAAMFRFTHDKIEQAAYQLMLEQQRREYHIRFGLALFANKLSNRTGNDELFFAAINQTNSGGPSAVYKPGKKSIIAGLNLKAGRRAIDLSDYRTAFKLFQHGISFLGDGHWTAHYKLSLDLYNAAAEAACVINNRDAVTIYSEQVVAHARCYDDKLNCLCSATKVLMNAELLGESMESTFTILVQVGEELPLPLGDNKLNGDIQVMNGTLQNMSDDSILNMKEATSERNGIVLKLYSNLILILQYHNPSLKGAVSLRMVDLTMKSGLSPTSPVAFACYGELLANIGEITEGCRLGRLALKLLQKRDLTAHTSSVIFYVYQTILWASDPLQSIADAHLLGRKAGQQSGDFVFSNLNWHLSAVVSYTAGSDLNTVRESIGAYIKEVQRLNTRLSAGFMLLSVLLHSHVVVLKEGLHVLDMDHIGDIPTHRGLLAKATGNPMLQLLTKITRLVRAFLFRQLDDVSENVDISDTIAKNKQQLCPLYLFGVFIEGLASFYLAREKTNEAAKWIKKGESVLARMRGLSEHSSWNWENKMLLLEAERMYTLNVDGAACFYEKAIRSARSAKFVHEEAIASELAGIFYCDTGLHQKSSQLLLHSVRKYETWGALAVAQRVEGFIESLYGSDITQWGAGDDALEHIFATSQDSSKKRQVIG